MVLAATGAYLALAYRPSAAQAWPSLPPSGSRVPALVTTARTVHRWCAWLVVLPALTLAAILYATVHNRAGRDNAAFLASSASIALLLLTAVAGLFPHLVPASNNTAYSLTLANAAATPRSLGVMLTIAAIGLPIVAGYTIWVYTLFSGKVRAEEKYS